MDMKEWDPEYVDSIGYEIWKDLSESFMPEFGPIDTRYLLQINTIRYLLWCTDPQRQWKSGTWNPEFTIGHVWDEEHLGIYEANKHLFGTENNL